MSALSVREIYETYIEPLSSSERRELLELLQAHGTEAEETPSITDLKGAGAEIWEEPEADEYIDGLRADWEHET